MANEQTLVVSWTGNTETDLQDYILQSGYADPGGIAFNKSITITKAEAEAASHLFTFIPANGGTNSNTLIPYDGTRWYRLFARDTAGNMSDPTTAQSKRIIRVGNKIKVRR